MSCSRLVKNLTTVILSHPHDFANSLTVAEMYLLFPFRCSIYCLTRRLRRLAHAKPHVTYYVTNNEVPELQICLDKNLRVSILHIKLAIHIFYDFFLFSYERFSYRNPHWNQHHNMMNFVLISVWIIMSIFMPFFLVFRTLIQLEHLFFFPDYRKQFCSSIILRQLKYFIYIHDNKETWRGEQDNYVD